MKHILLPEVSLKARTWILVVFTLAFSLKGMSQERQIQGEVSDAQDGSPLIGVTVQSTGISRGVITNGKGRYTIEVPETVTSLVFSYVGYQTDTVMIGERNVINVSMQREVKELDEIVVIGYGSIRKSDLTGSVSTVKSEDITKSPTSNAIQALQGKVPGLSVLSSSGEPGTAPIVRLRGITTLNNNNPIFVVDGVITDDVSFINANDIESVEVLKDASSTAIFGSRGSNGVIIITTKSGTTEKPRIQLSAEQGFESIARKLDLMNRDQFVDYYNAITPGRYTNPGSLPDIDWQDQVFNEMTPVTDLNASVSGVSDNLNYYISAGYYSQEGIMPKSSFQRLTGKINTEYSIRENIKLGLNMTISQRNDENPPGIITTIYRAFPIDAPYDPVDDSLQEVRGSDNPLAALRYSNSLTKGLSSLGNIYGEITFLEDFRFKSSFQYDIGATKGRDFAPSYYISPTQRNDQSSLEKSYSDRSQFIFEQTVSYNKVFSDDHRLDVVTGMSSQLRRSEYLNVSTRELLRNTSEYWYIDAGNQELLEAGNNATESSLVSYLFRANYVLSDRYLFTATYRLDGSSNFGRENKYGQFPSGAFGWKLSNEPFFPDLPFIDNIKYRLSYGLVGNEKIMGSSQYETIGIGGGIVLGPGEEHIPGATFESSGNPFLKWETTKQFNTGLDLEFFNRKIIAEIDYYDKRTEDILVFLRPAGWAGLGAYSYVTFNAADVKNRGWEFRVDYRERIGEVDVEVGALGTFIHNEVTSLAEDIGADSVLNFTGAQTRVGQPIGYYFGYDVIGVFQNSRQLEKFPHLPNQEEGDFIYRDVNRDGEITIEDRTKLGNSIPSFIYGFNLAAAYKGFRLSLDFQGQHGNKIFNRKQQRRFSEHNFETKFTNYWTGPGSTNEHPKPSAAGVNYNVSSYFIEDGSFLRLRTATLNYALPERWLQTLAIEQAHVYLRANNVFTLTSFSGYSPDVGANNALKGIVDDGIYPATRVYSVGLNITF